MAQVSVKPYEPTAGVKAILQELSSETRNGFNGIQSAVECVGKAKSGKVQAEQALVDSIKRLEYAELCLRQMKRKLAHLINDLGKLGCPEEEIRRAWTEWNAHDVAEWIQY